MECLQQECSINIQVVKWLYELELEKEKSSKKVFSIRSTSEDLLASICLNCLKPVVDRSAVDVFGNKNSEEAKQGSEYPCLSSSWRLQQTFFCSFCLVLFL